MACLYSQPWLFCFVLGFGHTEVWAFSWLLYGTWKMCKVENPQAASTVRLLKTELLHFSLSFWPSPTVFPILANGKNIIKCSSPSSGVHSHLPSPVLNPPTSSSGLSPQALACPRHHRCFPGFLQLLIKWLLFFHSGPATVQYVVPELLIQRVFCVS